MKSFADGTALFNQRQLWKDKAKTGCCAGGQFDRLHKPFPCAQRGFAANPEGAGDMPHT